jgi:hypothetical protein
MIKKEQKNDDKPSARTLFVLNVPSYCTEDSLKYTFNCFGHVDRVYLHTKPVSNDETKPKSSYFVTKTNQLNDFKIAYVVFNSPGCLNKSINQPIDEVKILSTKEKPIHTGIRSINSSFFLFLSRFWKFCPTIGTVAVKGCIVKGLSFNLTLVLVSFMSFLCLTTGTRVVFIFIRFFCQT